jgi:colanic acid biosynthesis glycosyl transferase WcaI
MMKRILLLGGNFSPEQTGIGKYNGEMIQWFAEHGYECTVITTAPYYPQWEAQAPYSNRHYSREILITKGNPIEVYRCPHYVPACPDGKKRILSDLTFSITSFFALLRVLGRKKFDHVITVAPPFFLGFHALVYKLFRGARFVYHIQDLQIEAARDLGMIKSKKFLNFSFRMEKYILNRADAISTISAGMLNKVKEKAGKDIIYFPNWADTCFFHPLPESHELKKARGFLPTDKIILYSGAIGEKQGLECILNSAKTFQSRKELKFVICGSGPYKEKLQQKALEEKLDNVHFIPLQPQHSFNAFLNMADVHLVIQKKHAGDLVMPSKLTTILAVGGLALVTAGRGTSLYDTICTNGIGLLAEPEDQAKFNEALIHAVEGDHSVLRCNARKYAEVVLSIDKVLSRFVRDIEGTQKIIYPAFTFSVHVNKELKRGEM